MPLTDDANDDATTTGRDRAGRFTPGHGIKSPGSPVVRRLHELQGAVRDAVSADDLRGVLKKLRDAAMGGDVLAARCLLDRACGRARESEPPIDVDFPENLSTASGIRDGIVALVRAAGEGRVAVDVADKLAALLARAGEAEAYAELERRLAIVEGRGK